MSRRTLRIQRVTRLVLSGTAKVPCADCGHDVPGISPAEAIVLLHGGENLQRLVTSAAVHVIETVGGGLWICRDSIFKLPS